MTITSDRWARIAELFDQAQERPQHEQAAFLDGACGSDHELRADVLALLDAGNRAGDFMAPSGPGVGALLLGDTSPTLQAGAMVGAYRIERPLGQGGMGVVYLAEDTRLGRPVTLKVLHAHDTADETRRERLRFEARAAAALVHPNIGAVHALEDLDGQLCIVGEYMPGRTARDMLGTAGALPVIEAIDVAVQVARGLDAAHRHGIIHRDLKPENILVGDNGIVRILDFGIARAVKPQADRPRLTEAGAAVGTPGYMSPEQLEGGAGDFRSDLFAFGTVLYELVTGKNPFQGATSSSTAARILTAEPAPLSSLNPLSPPELDAIIEKCHKKHPEERYGCTADLVKALESLARSLASGVASPVPRPQIEADAPADPSARVLWRIHQSIVVLILSGLAISSWWVAAWVGGRLRYTLFAAVLALTVADGTMRVHLLFAERHTPAAVAAQLARTRPWLLRLDVMVALIVALSASQVLANHQVVGAALLAVSAAMAVTAWAVEPTTTDAAFPRGSHPPS
jgi:serine/threonine protein kinase